VRKDVSLSFGREVKKMKIRFFISLDIIATSEGRVENGRFLGMEVRQLALHGY